MAKPENVRVRRPDGTEMPCELIHEGHDPVEDIDRWLVAGVVFRPGIDQLKVGMLPARTSIEVDVA